MRTTPRSPATVAIKVLPDHWMADPEHRARLEREARLLAALNHPNIGAIHGIAESGGDTGTRARADRW